MRASPVTLSVSLTIPVPLAPTKFRFSGGTFHFTRCDLNIRSFAPRGRLVLEQPSWRLTFCCKCRIGKGNGHAKSEVFGEDEEFIVVNFYRFVYIEDPAAEIAKHLNFLKDLNIHGRIYLNEQGINAQYSGPSRDALSYVEWLKGDERFSNLLVQISPAINGHAFPKLKLQNKPSLVQYEGRISHLPLLDPPMRAKPLEPSEWKRKLEELKEDDEASPSNSGRSCILLDVRNGYEWDVGHFRGARRPEVDCFRNTSFGQSNEEIATRVTAARYGVKLSPSFLVPSNWTGCLGVKNNYESLLPNKKALFDIPVARTASAYLTSLLLAAAAFISDGSFNGGDNALYIRPQFFYNNPLLSFIQFAIGPYADDLGNVLPNAVEGVGVPVDPLAFAGLLGMVVTSLNLLPCGRLEGGRIAQAMFGRSRAAILSFATSLLLGIGGLNGSVLCLAWGLFATFFRGGEEVPAKDEITPLGDDRYAWGCVLGLICFLTLFPNTGGTFSTSFFNGPFFRGDP